MSVKNFRKKSDVSVCIWSPGLFLFPSSVALLQGHIAWVWSLPYKRSVSALILDYLFRAVRNTFPMFKPSSIWCFFYRISNWLGWTHSPPEYFESTPAREEYIYHLVVLTPKEEIMTIVANQMGGMGRKDGHHHANMIGPSCFSKVTQFRASQCDGCVSWEQFVQVCPWLCDFISDIDGHVESISSMLINAKTPRREVRWLSSFLFLLLW